MPENTGPRNPERTAGAVPDDVVDRVRAAGADLTTLLREAEAARLLRAEAAGDGTSSAVCAWNHFENIPTFYNWNNRPR